MVELGSFYDIHAIKRRRFEKNTGRENLEKLFL